MPHFGRDISNRLLCKMIPFGDAEIGFCLLHGRLQQFFEIFYRLERRSAIRIHFHGAERNAEQRSADLVLVRVADRGRVQAQLARFCGIHFFHLKARLLGLHDGLLGFAFEISRHFHILSLWLEQRVLKRLIFMFQIRRIGCRERFFRKIRMHLVGHRALFRARQK